MDTELKTFNNVFSYGERRLQQAIIKKIRTTLFDGSGAFETMTQGALDSYVEQLDKPTISLSRFDWSVVCSTLLTAFEMWNTRIDPNRMPTEEEQTIWITLQIAISRLNLFVLIDEQKEPEGDLGIFEDFINDTFDKPKN